MTPRFAAGGAFPGALRCTAIAPPPSSCVLAVNRSAASATDSAPLSSASKASPDELAVLLAHREARDAPGSLPGSAVRSHDTGQRDKTCLDTQLRGLEILADEIYLNDIRGALDWDRVAAAIDDVTAAASTAAVPNAVRRTALALRAALKEVKKRHVPIHVLAPTIWHGKDNSSTELDPARITVAIAHGREIESHRARGTR